MSSWINFVLSHQPYFVYYAYYSYHSLYLYHNAYSSCWLRYILVGMVAFYSVSVGEKYRVARCELHKKDKSFSYLDQLERNLFLNWSERLSFFSRFLQKYAKNVKTLHSKDERGVAERLFYRMPFDQWEKFEVRSLVYISQLATLFNLGHEHALLSTFISSLSKCC